MLLVYRFRRSQHKAKQVYESHLGHFYFLFIQIAIAEPTRVVKLLLFFKHTTNKQTNKSSFLSLIILLFAFDRLVLTNNVIAIQYVASKREKLSCKRFFPHKKGNIVGELKV